MRVLLAGALLAVSAWAATNSEHVKIAEVAMKGDMDAVRALVKEHPADVNAPLPDGGTALLWAAYWNDEAAADALIAAGANVNAANTFGVTPLSQACINGNAKMVEMLLKAGADANSFQQEGQTALMTAAKSGNADAVKALLDHGADPNAKESWRGQTALMWATAENHPAVVQMLVDHGADVNLVSAVFDFSGMKMKPGDVPMHFPRGGFTALLFAARGGFTECAKILLDHGADITIGDPDKTSALVLAIINGHYDTAAFLMDRKADVNALDDNGRGPLYAAVDMRDMYLSNRPSPRDPNKLEAMDIIKMLLDRGANPNAKLTKMIVPRAVLDFPDMMMADGTTPFLRAAKSSDIPLMELLLAKGADPKLKTKAGVTALMVAAGMAHQNAIRGGEQPIDAMKICLDKGVEINAATEKTLNTALHAAAGEGKDDVVQFLLAHGANPNLKDSKNRTPMDVALGKDADAVGVEVHQSTAEILRKAMGSTASTPATAASTQAPPAALETAQKQPAPSASAR
ncbi:MAG TPA: ankyrin repeat domain-containing protein [Bryobacteraceae bacterium]|nr:ankyrin repeat domain-containing protein [Bryobacteraceae bacterium]